MISRKKMIELIILIGGLFSLLLIPPLFPHALMTDELSEGHYSVRCGKCHDPWKVPDESGCIECHDLTEIELHDYSQISKNCTVCHVLHGNDIGELNADCSACHVEVHTDQDIKELGCRDCHRGVHNDYLYYSHDNREVRKLVNKDDHQRSSNECYLCHDTEKFDEYNCIKKGCHGSSEEDKEHREEAPDWKTRDCFESDCHDDD